MNDDILSTSIEINNYKCFGKEPQGFNNIQPINLLVGRNNSGKSALIDLIEAATTTTPKSNLRGSGYKNKTPQIFFTNVINESDISKVFSSTTYGGDIPGEHFKFGKQWIESTAKWSLGNKGRSDALIDISNPPLDDLNNKTKKASREKLNKIGKCPFYNTPFERLLADRDIQPETAGDPGIDESGKGLTRTINKFINNVSYDRSIVENKMLNDLNAIFHPDAIFERILVQEDDMQWEIFLEEKGKGIIPISQSGSGLKTILIVLGLIHLTPKIINSSLDNIIFGLEELENNLHPSLQRRLFSFIRKIAIEENCLFFISTHSGVVIDLFSTDENAQTMHVLHSGDTSKAKSVTSYGESQSVLDDLDVRASDLLQSNGIIWVEGPSDRIYVNRWIDLWTDGELREGTHYQCVFYGGRLLSHLSADAPDENLEDKIQTLRVNRNAAILIDSDRSYPSEDLNGTKRRIIEEVNRMDGMAWVTEGREVENYLPRQAIEGLYPESDVSSVINKYEYPENYLDKVADEGRRFVRSKVEFAERIKPHISKEGIQRRLDLAEKVDELCQRIRSWNHMDS